LAAVAGEGFYRSDDGDESFESVSSEVGGAVMALAVTDDGRLLAGDMEQGLLASDDDGATGQVVAEAAVMGLAINPADSQTIVAGGPGVLFSTDGGRTWSQALALEQGAGRWPGRRAIRKLDTRSASTGCSIGPPTAAAPGRRSPREWGCAGACGWHCK